MVGASAGRRSRAVGKTLIPWRRPRPVSEVSVRIVDRDVPSVWLGTAGRHRRRTDAGPPRGRRGGDRPPPRWRPCRPSPRPPRRPPRRRRDRQRVGEERTAVHGGGAQSGRRPPPPRRAASTRPPAATRRRARTRPSARRPPPRRPTPPPSAATRCRRGRPASAAAGAHAAGRAAARARHRWGGDAATGCRPRGRVQRPAGGRPGAACHAGGVRRGGAPPRTVRRVALPTAAPSRRPRGAARARAARRVAGAAGGGARRRSVARRGGPAALTRFTTPAALHHPRAASPLRRRCATAAPLQRARAAAQRPRAEVVQRRDRCAGADGTSAVTKWVVPPIVSLPADCFKPLLDVLVFCHVAGLIFVARLHCCDRRGRICTGPNKSSLSTVGRIARCPGSTLRITPVCGSGPRSGGACASTVVAGPPLGSPLHAGWMWAGTPRYFCQPG